MMTKISVLILSLSLQVACATNNHAFEHADDKNLNRSVPVTWTSNKPGDDHRHEAMLRGRTLQGSCGNGNRGDGICADGTCCSQFGYCGITAEHCAGSCGAGFRGDGKCADGTCCSQDGYCGTTAEHCAVAKETCGDGFRGNGICDDGTCCSQDGYCGTTAEHCAGVNETCGDGFRGNGMCDDGSCCSQDGYCGFTAEHCGGESIGTTPGTEIIVPSESTYDNPSSKVIFGAVGGTLVFVALMFAAVVLPRRIKASRQKQEASHVATLPEVENDVATVLHAEPFFWTTATAVHPVESHATSAVPVHTTDATTVEHWPTFKCQCNNATSPSKVRLW